ncbi:uncharacterized protein LOC116296031 [Actinia tenebrosa]|uniref:Uncharacterized protein LOC116296031 n=1 Tax=Actinia tenebrosa TaxID=6105 RepID=A0A6P8HX06_ACTTE|nr:uncharacterized protein LOC116296031 [Actinia tenebrosa]
MKTNGKQQSLLAQRKEKEKKKERLCGWSQDKETLLRDDIGIESWFVDEYNSDDEDKTDRRYKCALVESLERRKRLAKERTKIILTPNSATNQNQNAHEPLRNREPTLSSKSSESVTVLSEESSESTSSSVGHVILSQSGPAADDTPCDTKWDFHSKDLTPRELDSFTTSNDSPIVTLLRYEKNLKNRRENRLNNRFGDVFRKVDKSDSISPKAPVNMTSVCFTQGMIQPMNNTAKNCRSKPRTVLPSLEMKNKSNAKKSKMASKLTNDKTCHESVKGVDAQECRGDKNQTNSIMRNNTSKKQNLDVMTENKTATEPGNKSGVVNGIKFNFDVLENYALVRNARKDINFTEYVKMIRKFEGLSVRQSLEKQLNAEEGKGVDFRTSIRRRNSSENLSFDTVRAMWNEAQRSRLTTQALSERLSLHAKGLGSILMLNVDPKSRSSSEPIGNEKEKYNYKGKFHSGKYTCPLQRILAVTNKRMQANEVFSEQIKNQKHLNVSRDKESTENKLVGITKSKTGIHCYVVGRTTPVSEDTAMEQ